jgi:hypothetical protein
MRRSGASRSYGLPVILPVNDLAAVRLHADDHGRNLSVPGPGHARRPGFGTKQSRAGLTATRRDRASRSGTCGARFPRETDLGVRLETLRADLRICGSGSPGREPFREPDRTANPVRPRTRTEHRLRFWALMPTRRISPNAWSRPTDQKV